ncbi:hypothetical protein [Paenibacillus medicaginis]|uniref:Uncharacterized protein n=1 Tax=Paenibacillus medicaginis TaxID=1470560 RepID=A0ABV5BUX4_9BACL
MKTNIFIPETIRIGFQNRDSTYTKKLAYVIYYDHKGKLRKEASWESWRDKKIEPVNYTNEPMSGFVLNKKVGDYVSDWNHRQAYVRVYDPRGFEFEITIENLLYILENANSIRGKGLEGEFVYGWDGKELILLPTSSPDYQEISQFNSILLNKEYIKSKDLKLGVTYKTKDNKEWVFLGKYDYYRGKKKIKKYFFYFKSPYGYDYFETLASLGDKLISVVSDDPVDNYSEIMEKLERDTRFSPYDESKDEPIHIEYDVFVTQILNNRWGIKYYTGGLSEENLIKIEEKYNEVGVYKVLVANKSQNYGWNWHRENTIYEGTPEEIHKKFNPMRKNKYLANGKLYQKEMI